MAQSFLAWGVITVIYCVVAICTYLLLSESHEWRHHEQTSNIIYLAVSVFLYLESLAIKIVLFLLLLFVYCCACSGSAAVKPQKSRGTFAIKV